MNQGGTRFSGFFGINDGGQGFILDFNQIKGILSNLGRFSDDGDNTIPDMAYFVHGQGVAGGDFDVGYVPATGQGPNTPV